MDLFSAFVLGIVQAITEWLPLSSKTQDTLVYLNFLHGSASNVIPVLLYLHIGTVLAATVYYRNEIVELLLEFVSNPTDLSAHSEGKLGFLATALFFTGVIGLPLLYIGKKILPTLSFGWIYAVMGAGLFITGFLLLKQKGSNKRTLESVGWKDGILTGVLQGLSILPGVSRAGTSTTGLIWSGFDSESSFYLSFLLSIPTVILAEVLFWALGGLAQFPLKDGLLLSASGFVFGFASLDGLLKLVNGRNLAYIAFAFGALILAVGLLGAG